MDVDARAVERRLTAGVFCTAFALTACTPSPPPQQQAATAAPSVSSFTLTAYRRGKVLWRMDAAHAVVDSDGATAEVFDGRVRFFGRNDAVSDARFERARVDLRTRNAHFPGHVLVRTSARETVLARDVVYVSSEGVARSTRAVTITRRDGLMRGSGFVARDGFRDILILDNEIIPR